MGKRPMCLLCLLLMMGMCLTDLLGFPLLGGNPLPDHIRTWIRRHPQAAVCGEAVRCEDTEFSQSIYLNNSYYLFGSEKISIDNVRVFLKEKQKVPVGAVVLVSGKLEEIQPAGNPGEFDSSQYYACSHTYYFLKKARIEKISSGYSLYGEFLETGKQRLSQILQRAGGTAAPVFLAMVLGEKGELEQETKERYQMGGIVHILAISGLHISLLGMGFYQLLKKGGLGVWAAGFLALAVMLQYGRMTGASVSTMRAVCMFLLSMGGQILGRCYDMLTALALSAVLLLLDAPANLYSSGFLLSFGAVLGIGILSPAVIRLLGAERKLARAFCSSLGVQLATLPVVLQAYGEVSVAGIFLNLLVLPTVGMVLASGVAGCILGLFWPLGAWLGLLPGRMLLFLYEEACRLAGRLPFCTWVAGQPQIWQMAVYEGILALSFSLGLFLKRKADREKRGKSFRDRGKAGMGAFVCGIFLGAGILILTWKPSGRLSITCLDVGQGDGIVAETPGRHHILIDGGSSDQSELCRYQLLPYLKSQGIRRLDGIFISHTDEDHISGVRDLLIQMRQKLTSVRAEVLVLPELEKKTDAYRELEELAAQAGVLVRTARQGDCWELDGVKIKVLSPPKDSSGENINEEAMVLEIEYGEFQGLFTGDIGAETEKKLLPVLSDVDFLKVGHHGSRYSSSQEFLDVIRPETAVISCSSANTYGHPAKEVIDRLENMGTRVEFTMKSGAVTICTDGREIQVKGFREP